MKFKLALTLLLALFICGGTYSQEKSKKKVLVTGKVINRDGTLISDVLIFLDGQKSPRGTNKSGKFKIKISPDTKKIAFYSFSEGGYELDYIGQTEMEIIINPDFPMLTIMPSEDGSTIETGYGTFRKDELTGTVSSIDENRFKSNTYKNIYEMIGGEVPGVTVVGRSIRIRGLSSFRMSNEPLFVVNGTPISSIDHIAPTEVESLDILKGPQTAMYGSRGATGVIVITLKGSGKKN